jgi:hypothetical protein
MAAVEITSPGTVTPAPSDFVRALAGNKTAAADRRRRRVLIKSRGRIFGKKASPEEIMRKVAALATKGLGMADIGAQCGFSASKAHRYLQKAVAAGLVAKTETGRVELPEEVKAAKVYAQLKMDEFVTKYPQVEAWVNDMRTRRHGKPIKSWRGLLSSFKTVCDTLELSPLSFLAGQDNAERIAACNQALTNFALAAQEGRVKYVNAKVAKQGAMSEAALRSYAMAVRNFAMFHGVAFPRGIAGVLSGKKVSYGKYAHVKLSFQKLDELVRWLGAKYGYASKEQAAFVFYYLTCARNQAGVGVRLDHFVTHPNGWVTCEVYESKTETPWTKYLPADNPHQKILIDYLAKRSGNYYAFIDSEADAQNVGKHFTKVFAEAYRACGITEPYFYLHPVHALRHAGAHYWLNRPEVNYNHSIVATIGGWKYVGTLVDCYGKMPPEFVMRTLAGAPVAAPATPATATASTAAVAQ